MGPSSIFEYRLFDLKCPTMLVLLHSSGTSALSELPEITSSPFRAINITDLLSRSLCGHPIMYMQTQVLVSMLEMEREVLSITYINPHIGFRGLF